MRIAIIGSSGYIAAYLKKSFLENSSLEFVGLDKVGEPDIYIDLSKITDFDFNLLNNIDFVIFTAAISGPDICANDYDNCWNINVIGTSRLISEALTRNCKIIFFSSDAVFGEDRGVGFNENSETCAKTAYGMMKKEVEDRFKNNKNFKAIRLSYVVSKNDKFTKYCLNCIKTNIEADIFHPFYRNCISITDVVDAVNWMINNWKRYPYTFLNIAGDELVSRVRIADEINRIMDGKLKYKIGKPKTDFFENRPAITQMNSLFLKEFNIVEPESFTKKIERELKEN